MAIYGSIADASSTSLEIILALGAFTAETKHHENFEMAEVPCKTPLRPSKSHASIQQQSDPAKFVQGSRWRGRHESFHGMHAWTLWGSGWAVAVVSVAHHRTNILFIYFVKATKETTML
jgi:hypothetical protein